MILDIPLWSGDSDGKQAAEVGEQNFILFCPVCAKPPPFSYQWYFNGLLIPDGYMQNYTIETVTEKDFGNYTCSVNNNVGNNQFPVELVKLSLNK